MEKKYSIEYLPVAVRDLQGIFDYISGELSSPKAAGNLLCKIDASVSRLSAFPFSCEKTKDAVLNKKGYRTLIVENYIVFYVVLGQTAEIRRILYNKTSYGSWLF